MYKTTNDDIFAYALSKTLTKVPSPATVGLYSTCQNRISMILGQMAVYMKQEALKIEQKYEGSYKPRSVTPSLCGCLALIGRMLFYRPIWTEENQQLHNIRFINVHFSPWHFASSDLLWAGLAMRLFQSMQMNFGKFNIVLYRVVQHDEEEEVKKKRVEDSRNHWKSKKVCCCPLWFLCLSIIVVPLIILIIFLTVGLPEPELQLGAPVNGTSTQMGVMDGVIIAAIGVPAASAVRFIFQMCKNLIFSLDLNIRKGMDNDRLSIQLGFMNEVRKEMWFLSQFIQFMEVFERRRIRVVLKITNLDRCSPKKIVAVLDAINILLSDEESPYISILAVDPDVIVQKVNFADGCYTKEDRGYALLNRIVTLAFTVPPLCDDSKRRLFDSLTRDIKKNECVIAGEEKLRVGSLEETHCYVFDTNESYPLMDRTTAALEVEEEVEKLIRSILTSNEKNLNKYMLEDAMSMRREINSMRLTVIIMKALKKELPQPDYIAAWVVLANQWPCRLSWIIQCVEDTQQRAVIDQNNEAGIDDSQTLWEVFSESRAELYVMSAHIEDLLQQDGDPEMFERFLKMDFPFTVKDLKTFEVATVNLDRSIRKELAQLRGTARLNDTGWMRDLAPLPITTIINMDKEDVCKELERMKYPSKYIDIVRSNDLNGLALFFGDADDLKVILDMTIGEWATFRLHFLGLKSHIQPQYQNMAQAPSHSQNQSRCRLHAPQQ
ncbi:NTPase KAP family P-loop domain-containing protein 1 isoform X2 [Pseudoliparis swirei]|nr:NTPase KAP family P-loop domain-containing protein 1 isoform X2 [Pseudoliparis swirei]XP_056268552.1 NTPase KAP family P-loop domain-containing protein 1 isoform X2 [Pseudoliparis swirei]XP_056268553.1 NTPase KAP family P-loop domain-containing protein 1 isoform X2 [Pseudoliparis swirei]XP_056268554.1 NTPase KAP family P-loop domain-containing protein 1 isoform X2 [Pseudoliparis swirei]